MGLQHLLLKCECFTESEVKNDDLEAKLSDELGLWTKTCLQRGLGFNAIACGGSIHGPGLAENRFETFRILGCM